MTVANLLDAPRTVRLRIARACVTCWREQPVGAVSVPVNGDRDRQCLPCHADSRGVAYALAARTGKLPPAPEPIRLTLRHALITTRSPQRPILVTGRCAGCEWEYATASFWSDVHAAYLTHADGLEDGW